MGDDEGVFDGDANVSSEVHLGKVGDEFRSLVEAEV